MIAEPGDKLARALTQLDAGERWLVEPRQLGDEGRLWSPGVRVGVQPGSWFHRTECFGPVLGVIRADDLDHAIAIQNAVEFGLTGGIHALDDAEIERWLAAVEVGNAYVNRHTTGAIVRRQPFGGWKRSSVGRGAKTGGPGDVLRFVDVHRHGGSLDCAAALTSYRRWWDAQFGVELDRSGLRSEANVLRYRPVHGVIVRLSEDVEADAVATMRDAAALAGVPVEFSTPTERAGARVETDDELAGRLQDSSAERLRLLGTASDELRLACFEAGISVDETSVTGDGRVELPCWLREQAISRTLHRHGRVATADPSPAGDS